MGKHEDPKGQTGRPDQPAGRHRDTARQPGVNTERAERLDAATTDDSQWGGDRS